MTPIELTIPMKLLSCANRSEHWMVRRRRDHNQRWAVKGALLASQSHIFLPATITLVNVTNRLMDEDNLSSAFKAIRDQIADWVVPGLRPGMADSHPDITWKYAQEKVKLKDRAIKIIITST